MTYKIFLKEVKDGDEIELPTYGIWLNHPTILQGIDGKFYMYGIKTVNPPIIEEDYMRVERRRR